MLDESYWGTEFVSLVEQLGNRSTGMYKYCASKALAERGSVYFHYGPITAI